MSSVILSGNIILQDGKILLLYRKDHGFYETPGGKVKPEECSKPGYLTIEDLAKAAKRELLEELGDGITIEEMSYFANVEFTIPDGRRAVAHKFMTRIKGEPRINEPLTFSRLEYLPIEGLEDHPISPDLHLLLPRLRQKA